MLGFFQPYDRVHIMLWFGGLLVITVLFSLAVRTGVVVYVLIGYWKFRFANPMLVSNGSYTYVTWFLFSSRPVLWVSSCYVFPLMITCV